MKAHFVELGPVWPVLRRAAGKRRVAILTNRIPRGEQVRGEFAMEELAARMRAALLIEERNFRQIVEARVETGVEPDQPISARRFTGSDCRRVQNADRLEDLFDQHVPNIGRWTAHRFEE